jgi:hypothetical protein
MVSRHDRVFVLTGAAGVSADSRRPGLEARDPEGSPRFAGIG